MNKKEKKKGGFVSFYTSVDYTRQKYYTISLKKNKKTPLNRILQFYVQHVNPCAQC